MFVMKIQSFKYYIVTTLLVLSSAGGLAAAGQPSATKTENVVLVTIDGVRWQDVFEGADMNLIKEKEFLEHPRAEQSLIERFATGSAETKRKNLMPFLWNTIAKEGVILGDRTQGASCVVSNRHRFSYPGYSELLTGVADDDVIKSNDKIQNPNVTVLEYLNQRDDFKGRVAAFGSWDVFAYIVNEQRSGVLVNDGFESLEEISNARVAQLNELQRTIPSHFGSVRMDAFTYNFAFEYLQEKRPRVLYIALGEPDDFAHDGTYDMYLDSLQRADAYLAKLWQWIQSDKQYQNKTTLLITTDHGRGHIEKASWKHHGAKQAGAENVWIAAIGPDTAAKGAIRHANVESRQVAPTVSQLLGVPFKVSNNKYSTPKVIESIVD